MADEEVIQPIEAPGKRVVERALTEALRYFEHRDRMNAVVHLSDPRWSDITVLVRRAMIALDLDLTDTLIRQINASLGIPRELLEPAEGTEPKPPAVPAPSNGTTGDVALVRQALSLLNSMVLSGENHTDESRSALQRARAALTRLGNVRGGPPVCKSPGCAGLVGDPCLATHEGEVKAAGQCRRCGFWSYYTFAEAPIEWRPEA